MNDKPSVELSLHSPRFKPAPCWDDPFWQAVQAEIDFSIIGAAKAGTTWLHSCLRQHSGIFLPDEHNLLTLFHERGPAYYNALYHAAPSRMAGDYSTTYYLDPELPHALAQRYPRLKIIMVCRNPIQRAFSHYLMDVNKRVIDPRRLSFLEALQCPVTFSYYNQGLYYQHIMDYRRYFTADAMLILIFEEVIGQPEAAIDRVFKFLEVERSYGLKLANKENTWIDQYILNNKAYRAGRSFVYRLLPRWLYELSRHTMYPRLRDFVEYVIKPPKPQLPPAVHDLLREKFYKPNRQLEELLGVDLSMWDR